MKKTVTTLVATMVLVTNLLAPACVSLPVMVCSTQIEAPREGLGSTGGVTSRLYNILETTEINYVTISENESDIVSATEEEAADDDIEIVEEEEVEEVIEYIEVDSTAYYNLYNAHCADGTWPKPGVLAGKREWLGKSVDLYDKNYNYMGSYTFHDTGYGQATGWGKSSLIKGKTVGTIEAGLCIDVFFNTKSECIKYGRRKLYMVWRE